MRLGLLPYVYKLWLRVRINLERSKAGNENTLPEQKLTIQTVIQIHLLLS
jgi:hypothetical protein